MLITHETADSLDDRTLRRWWPTLLWAMDHEALQQAQSDVGPHDRRAVLHRYIDVAGKLVLGPRGAAG